MPRKKLYTEEEKKEKARNNYLDYQKPKEEADWKRLAWVRIGDDYSRVTKKEWKKFKEEIREKNSKRFDEIFNDEALWNSLNTSSEIWQIKKARQERKKKNGDYVNHNDVERAIQIIYGGMKGEIIEEDKEEEYENPYQNETNEQ